MGNSLVQIQVSTRHGQLSEASQTKIAGKAEKLLRIFERLTAIDMVVDLKDDSETPGRFQGFGRA